MRIAGLGREGGHAGARVPRQSRLPSPHLLLAPLALAGAAAAALLGAWLRFIDVDGVSYLDVADAYLRGGWAEGANAYWSPLYPWLLAGAMRLTNAPQDGELLLAQVVNFLIFVLALAAFIAFWSELDRYRSRGSRAESRDATFGVWAWWGMGYALFFWCAFRLNTVWGTRPDMLVMAAGVAAGALLLRMRRDPSTWHLPVVLGVILGLAFLAKAVMFLLGFVFVVAAWGASGADRRAIARAGLALLVFLAVAAPFVGTLSLQKQRFTFGDSGRLNYARFVNGVPDIHWQGETPGSGAPTHPTRRLAAEPATFEFATPVGGTYPVWYDPTYWYEGVKPRLDPGQQLSALVRTGRTYLDLLLLRQGAAAAVVLLLLIGMGRERSWGVPNLARLWFLWVPAAAGIGLYALVYVEGRYVAPFLILGWGAALASVRVTDDPLYRRLLTGAAVLVALVMVLNFAMPKEKVVSRHLRSPQPTNSGPWFEVGASGTGAQLPAARALAELGLRRGDPVAFIGYSYYAYWARLAGLRIIAEVPMTESHLFWEADEDARARITSTLFSAGPRAIVTLAQGQYRPPEGWRQLGGTAYYVLLAPDGGDAHLQ
jgi:hypothetical protein